MGKWRMIAYKEENPYHIVHFVGGWLKFGIFFALVKDENVINNEWLVCWDSNPHDTTECGSISSHMVSKSGGVTSNNY